MESTAASTLTTTPRLMPRDSATPMPTTSSVPSSMLSPTTVVTREVPTSRPTRYRSLRATGPPLPAGSNRTRPPLCSCSRPYVHALVESQIHVVNRRNALAKRGREVKIRLKPLGKLLRADAYQRGVTLQDENGVADVADVDFGNAAREVGAHLQGREDTGRQRGARVVDERPVVARRRRKAVDDRQIELGVVRPEL